MRSDLSATKLPPSDPDSFIDMVGLRAGPLRSLRLSPPPKVIEKSRARDRSRAPLRFVAGRMPGYCTVTVPVQAVPLLKPPSCTTLKVYVPAASPFTRPV